MENLKNKVASVLRWSEKYTKTDMTYLAKGSFWNILSQILVSASTFLLAIAFAHFVSKEAYGEYKFVLSLVSIFGVFSLTGLGTVVLQSVNQGHEGTLKYAFWKNIKWSALFFLVSLGASIYYFSKGNDSIGTALLIAGTFSPFLNSTNLYNYYLEAKKDFRRSAIYFNIIGNIFPAICLFIGMVITSKPIWLIAIFFTSNTLIGLILYYRVVKIYKPNKTIDTKALGYSKHLSLMGIMGGITGSIDQIIVFHYLGGVELAIYNFAIAIPKQMKGPLKGLASLIFPKFVERSDREIRLGMKNKLLYLFIASFFIISAYIFIAPYIFRAFFPKYTDSIFYSQIFSLSLFWIVAIPANAYLVAKKKIREQYFNSVIGPVIQIVFLFVGVILGGLLGLIIARVATTLISSIISIALYEKSSKEII